MSERIISMLSPVLDSPQSQKFSFIMRQVIAQASDLSTILELQKLSVEFKEITLTRSPYQMVRQSVEYGSCTEKIKRTDN